MALVAPAVPNSLQVAPQEPGSKARRAHKWSHNRKPLSGFSGERKRLSEAQISAVWFYIIYFTSHFIYFDRVATVKG